MPRHKTKTRAKTKTKTKTKTKEQTKQKARAKTKPKARPKLNRKAASPAASGPAGSHFEGQVGAHYLLTMLVGAEPRGLPTAIIDRVEFQRAAEGRPLDDVVVHAHDPLGSPVVLEVQVKRALTFSPADPIFGEVVWQIARASQPDDFWSTQYGLAIAVAKGSRKIDGAYQDVLRWAREMESAEAFFQRLSREGSANDDMRAFVATFRRHLQEAGVAVDDDILWRLLVLLSRRSRRLPMRIMYLARFSFQHAGG
jgi:hypothetical protein